MEIGQAGMQTIQIPLILMILILTLQLPASPMENMSGGFFPMTLQDFLTSQTQTEPLQLMQQPPQ